MQSLKAGWIFKINPFLVVIETVFCVHNFELYPALAGEK
jgi:hypothetical protein